MNDTKRRLNGKINLSYISALISETIKSGEKEKIRKLTSTLKTCLANLSEF